MLPILVPIVSMLAEKGLGLLSKAFDAGSDKVVQLVEEKTGIKIDETTAKKGLSNEDVTKLKEFQLTYELELARIALSKLQEDNRHTETLVATTVNDVANARGSDHLYELQREVGQKVFIQTSILIPLLICLDVLLVIYAKDLFLSEAMISGVSMLIGVALNNAYRERQSMIEFLFGSSLSSRMKDINSSK